MRYTIVKKYEQQTIKFGANWTNENTKNNKKVVLKR